MPRFESRQIDASHWRFGVIQRGKWYALTQAMASSPEAAERAFINEKLHSAQYNIYWKRESMDATITLLYDYRGSCARRLRAEIFFPIRSLLGMTNFYAKVGVRFIPLKKKNQNFLGLTRAVKARRFKAADFLTEREGL